VGSSPTGPTDLFGVAPEDIHSVPVKLTMMDGRITHDTR
jgi:predicted amidohydrolase YtcJ